MKVLQINSCSGCLSTGKIVTDIGLELQNEGHECLIAYRLASVDRGVKTFKIGARWSVKFNTLWARLTDRTGFGSWYATRRLLNMIAKYSPDVVHLQTLHGDYVNIAMLFSYLVKHNFPTVISMHDCWLITGHCTHFVETGCDRWKTGCYSCPEKHSYPKSYFIDQSSRNYIQKKNLLTLIDNLALVLPSKWLSDIVGESFLSNAKREIVPNGIDLSIFCPSKSDFRAKYNLHDKKIVLGVASNWTKKKGLDDFIELSSRLDSNIKIVMAGLNESQIAALPKSICGISRTSNAKELAEIYTAADIFLNMTYEDTFGMVNIEAQACGTPVITYRTGGCPETITLQTGVVVEQGNIEAVVNAISYILNSSKDWHTNCLNNARNNYDRKICADSYLKVYMNLLERKHLHDQGRGD